MADLATKLTNALFEADQQRMILGADLRDPDRRGIEEVLRKALAGLIPEGSFTKADLFHAMDLVRSSGSTHTNHEIFGWMNGVTISERAPQPRNIEAKP